MSFTTKLIAAGIIAALLASFLGWARHQIYLADTAPIKAQYQSERDQAISDANIKVTAANTRADSAESTANEATKHYQDYLDTHPAGSVRMCRSAPSSSPGQIGTGAKGGSSVTDRNTPSGSVGTVPGGNSGQTQQQGPDIGHDLAAELRATLALVVIGRECEENLPK